MLKHVSEEAFDGAVEVSTNGGDCCFVWLPKQSA